MRSCKPNLFAFNLCNVIKKVNNIYLGCGALNQIDVNDLQLIVLPGKNPGIWLKSYYEKAYFCWKKTWAAAAKTLAIPKLSEFSTDFLRQDNILCVFYRGDCLSLGFWSEYDFRLSSSFEDSALGSWCPEALLKLASAGPHVAICTYLTVSHGYKKSKQEQLSLKDLQMNILVKRFLQSEASVMGGATRNDKGINKVCLRSGAKLLKKGVLQYGFDTDLVAWYKDARLWRDVGDLVDKLWVSRIDYRDAREGFLRLSLNPRIGRDLGLQKESGSVKSILSSKGS